MWSTVSSLFTPLLTVYFGHRMVNSHTSCSFFLSLRLFIRSQCKSSHIRTEIALHSTQEKKRKLYLHLIFFLSFFLSFSSPLSSWALFCLLFQLDSLTHFFLLLSLSLLFFFTHLLSHLLTQWTRCTRGTNSSCRERKEISWYNVHADAPSE